MNNKLGFKMNYSAGLKQTAPLYQEDNPSTGSTKVTYDAKGNRVTTKTTPDVVVAPVKGTPPVPAIKPSQPVTTYSPTAPGESQADADIRWTEYLKNNPSPTPPPSPPGGSTPPSRTSSVGKPGTPGTPDIPGYTIPGTSSSTLEKPPVNYSTGLSNQIVNNTVPKNPKGPGILKKVGWFISDTKKAISEIIPNNSKPKRRKRSKCNGCKGATN